MPVYKTKGRWRYEFDRIIANRRVRATKVLPKQWTSVQAHNYAAQEDARLYALATGQRPEPLIEDAVLLYCKERCPKLKHGDEYIHQLSVDYQYYAGKTFAEIQQVMSAIDAEDVSPATKRNRIAYIRAACNYAYKVHKLGTSRPSDHIQVPTVKNERVVTAGRKEVLQIARKAARRDVKAVIMIGLYSGLRQGEILRCSVSDNRFVVMDTKNGTTIHVVPVHPKLRVYTRYTPFNIKRSTFFANFSKARKLAGLDHITNHDERHMAASAMVSAGVDLYTVGKVLGHKDARSTQRYAHLNTDALEKAIRKIG